MENTVKSINREPVLNGNLALNGKKSWTRIKEYYDKGQFTFLNGKKKHLKKNFSPVFRSWFSGLSL